MGNIKNENLEIDHSIDPDTLIINRLAERMIETIQRTESRIDEMCSFIYKQSEDIKKIKKYLKSISKL